LTGGKRLPAYFYQSLSGVEPVREWLKSPAFSAAERRKLGEAIKRVEFGWSIGLPVCRSLGSGLWEVRTDLGRRTARILFCVRDARMVLLHGFIKKSRATPNEDLMLAQGRRRRLEKKE
jgi:phage-related protein